MQLFYYFFGTPAPVVQEPVPMPDWSLLSHAEAEAKVIEFLDSKNYTPLFSRVVPQGTTESQGNYFDQIHPISEATQIRLVNEVPGWTVRNGLFYGEIAIYPEKILLACLTSPDAADWIANPLILTKQAKQTAFIITALAKFPELVLKHPGLWFRVNHEVFHSKEFALAVTEFGSDALFTQDEDGDTFLFNRFFTEETVAHLFSVLGQKDFCRLVTIRNKEKEHFAYSYKLNPETVMAVIDALPSELREGFVLASSQKGHLFTKTANGGSNAVTKWCKENGVTLGRATRTTRSTNTHPNSPGIEGWASGGSPKI